MMNTNLARGMHFIWENARALERAIFEYRFLGSSPTRVLTILQTYQNEDGGFGHALEPDLRTPASQPVFVEFALRTLYECKLYAPEMAYRVCDFLAQHADLEKGIPAIFSSSSQYPRAAHWNNPAAEQPSLDRLAGLVGLANWQEVDHPWLIKAAATCLEKITTTHYEDAHTILNAFCLIESLGQEENFEEHFRKLTHELFRANFFCLETPVRSYGLTPLEFAPTPEAYCRGIFSDMQIEAHLDELASHQVEDGGWPVQWEPPGEMARLEWRAYKTVHALITLRAYGRI